MYALPVVIVNAGEPRFAEGTLFKLPPELRTKNQMTYYASRASKGWSICPQGYHIYVDIDQNGSRYVIPGLIIEGERRPKKKFYAHPFVFSKQQIVDFTRSLIQEFDRVQRAKEEELRVLVHDLRALSSAIYNAAIDAKYECEHGNIGVTQGRLDTVLATHTMLSIRIDLLDFLTNQIVTANPEQISVFRKVDKVVRCFRPKASVRGLDISLRGTSRAFTYGPGIFELIPYAIIDNAVKYAPDRSEIRVEVRDEQSTVAVRVQSLGPHIEPGERLRIFEKGFRGTHALQTGREGTGIGLNTAKQLLDDHFGGSITVEQERLPVTINGIEFFTTAFELVVPRR